MHAGEHGEEQPLPPSPFSSIFINYKSSVGKVTTKEEGSLKDSLVFGAQRVERVTSGMT